LDEEAARAPKPAAADETLSQSGSSGYLTGIGASPQGPHFILPALLIPRADPLRRQDHRRRAARWSKITHILCKL
jgi:hypothetical protein